ncbi:MAG: hypothetical protein L6R41_008436, partial [Letrouitia leprolyta]
MARKRTTNPTDFDATSAADREAQPEALRDTPLAKQSSNETTGVAKRTPKKRSFDEIEDMDNRPPPQGTPSVHAM